MSTLHLQFMRAGRIIGSLPLSAENEVSTSLVVTSGQASLPSLISVENIIGKINHAGFELVNDNEIRKLSALINTRYIPVEQTSWRDEVLAIEASPITSVNASIYQEIHYVREAILSGAQNFLRYEAQRDYKSSKKAQDTVYNVVATSAQNKPVLWQKIAVYLAKTVLAVIFESIIGFPIHLVFSHLGLGYSI